MRKVQYHLKTEYSYLPEESRILSPYNEIRLQIL